MTKSVCKAILKDGSPCTGLVDEGQKYCPYHLATQADKLKSVISWIAKGAGLVATFAVIVNNQMKKKS